MHQAMGTGSYGVPFFPLLILSSFWTVLASAPIVDSTIVGRLGTTMAMERLGFSTQSWLGSGT